MNPRNKFKVGQKYLTRGGREATIVEIDPSKKYPMKVKIELSHRMDMNGQEVPGCDALNDLITLIEPKGN